MRNTSLAALLALLAVDFSLTSAQAPSGSISGVVRTDESSPQPIGRAVVTISGGDLRRPMSTMTDGEGRFSFIGISGGRFTLTAAKPAFITTAYGAKRPGKPGTPITIEPGQQRRDVTIQLARGGVITGTIRDADGQPIPGAPIVAFRTDQPAPTVSSSLFSEHVADDRGVYRLFGLIPGDYILAAGGGTTSAELTMPSAAENDAALRALASRGSGPGFQAAGSARPVETRFAGGVTFYPGTASATEASVIPVKAGEERVADFVASPTPSAAVSGVITDARGRSVALNLTTAGPTLPSLMGSSPTLVQRPGDDGAFRYVGVRPGKYVLVARTVTGGTRGAAVPPPQGQSAAPLLWARADLDVAGRDVEGIALTLQPAMKLRGRVVFDAETSAPPSSMSTLLISLAAPDVTLASGLVVPQAGVINVTPARVAPDGTFELTGILPGVYRVGTSAPSGWWPKSATLGTRDALDDVVQFGDGGDITGLVVTFSNRHAEVSGVLQTPAGSAATDYFVVAFPADRAFWQPSSRRTRAVRPATDGHYSLDLPAGRYLLAALTDVEPSDLDNVKFLESIVGSAIEVALGDGGKEDTGFAPGAVTGRTTTASSARRVS